MPLYEYDCGTCGCFEQIRRFSDPPLEACPTCSGPIEKRFSAPAFQFKGTGWYVTDYARKGANGEGKKESGEGKKESAPSSATATTATTESKSTTTSTDSSTSSKPSTGSPTS